MNDKKLWKAFSEFIRLRDSDENGYCKCFTCSRVKFWKFMDAGHGLGRQHKSIKYDERDVHAQCGPCNMDGGRQDVYKEEVNKRYGPQTWDLLLLKSRQPFKWSQFEINVMTEHYKKEVRRLLKEKHIDNGN